MTDSKRWLAVVARHHRDGDYIEAFATREEAEAAVLAEVYDDPTALVEGEHTIDYYLAEVVVHHRVRSHY